MNHHSLSECSRAQLRTQWAWWTELPDDLEAHLGERIVGHAQFVVQPKRCRIRSDHHPSHHAQVRRLDVDVEDLDSIAPAPARLYTGGLERDVTGTDLELLLGLANHPTHRRPSGDVQGEDTRIERDSLRQALGWLVDEPAGTDLRRRSGHSLEPDAVRHPARCFDAPCAVHAMRGGSIQADHSLTPSRKIVQALSRNAFRSASLDRLLRPSI